MFPAHPLALDAKRAFDAHRQRARMRYYVDAGRAGLAVGVHTTQFTIRNAGLYEPVLRTAAETVTDRPDRPVFMSAGLSKHTKERCAGTSRSTTARVTSRWRSG